ncbi:hypothetical protein WKI72_03200 [Candidatus Erwinia dacicola]
MLAELYPQMNADDLQERLARILFVSTLWGRLHDAYPEAGYQLPEIQRL